MPYDDYARNFGAALSSMAAPPQGAFSAVPPQGGGFAPQQSPMPPPQGAGPGIVPPQGGGFSRAPQGAGEAVTFQGLFKDGTKAEKDRIVKDLESSGVDIDAKAEEAAQQDPETASKYGAKGPTAKGLSKQEKAGLLMEFGLRMMQASGQGESFAGAVGQAGLGTMGTHKAQQAAKTKAAQDAAAAKQEQQNKARELASRETQAQASKTQAEAAIKRAGAGVNELIKGEQGNAIAVMDDGTTKDLGVPWNESMTNTTTQKPSATRDKYNLFMESFKRQNPNADPKDLAKVEEAALKFATQSGKDETVGARETAARIAEALVSDDAFLAGKKIDEKRRIVEDMIGDIANVIITGKVGGEESENPYAQFKE